MTFGTKQLKNGKTTGYLYFSCTNKTIYLNSKELTEFNDKIDYWRKYQP